MTAPNVFYIIVENYRGVDIKGRGISMNSRLLKAKRVEHGLRQKDLAKALGITEKSMCLKERSAQNKFKASEMIILSKVLELSLSEFNLIFFDGDLPFV